MQLRLYSERVNLLFSADVIVYRWFITTEIFHYLNDGTSYKIQGPDGAQSHFDQLFALNKINNNISQLREQVSDLTPIVGGRGSHAQTSELQDSLTGRLQKADNSARLLTEPITAGLPSATIRTSLNGHYNHILHNRAENYVDTIRSITGY